MERKGKEEGGTALKALQGGFTGWRERRTGVAMSQLGQQEGEGKEEDLGEKAPKIL